MADLMENVSGGWDLLCLRFNLRLSEVLPPRPLEIPDPGRQAARQQVQLSSRNPPCTPRSRLDISAQPSPSLMGPQAPRSAESAGQVACPHL